MITSIKIKQDVVVNSILAFMIIASIFDMGGGLGIKYLSYFLGVIAFIIFPKIPAQKFETSFIISILFLFYPLFSLLLGYFNDGDIALGISQITPFVPALIIFYRLENNDMDKLLKVYFMALYVLAILIIILYFIILILGAMFPIIESFIGFMNSRSMGMFGMKNLGLVVLPGVYFKATLFLSGAFIYYTYIKSYRKALIIFIAVFLTFSKSAILANTAFLFFLSLSIIRIERQRIKFNKNSLIITILIVIISVFLFISFESFFSPIYTYFEEAISGEAGTTQVRVRHMESLEDLFKENPFMLIFGQGVGTKFFTSATGLMAENIEIDHFNTIRKFGLVWSFVFYFIIFRMIYIFWKDKCDYIKMYAPILLFTFVLVGTNPLLINPLFLMFFVLLYKKYICLKYE